MVANKGWREREDWGGGGQGRVKHKWVGGERLGYLGRWEGGDSWWRGSPLVWMWWGKTKRKDYGESSCVIHPLYFHPSFPSSPLALCPLPSLHCCTLSATGPGKFPRARGSPLSVSSDTVIRSVGTESVPLSELPHPSPPPNDRLLSPFAGPHPHTPLPAPSSHLGNLNFCTSTQALDLRK